MSLSLIFRRQRQQQQQQRETRRGSTTTTTGGGGGAAASRGAEAHYQTSSYGYNRLNNNNVEEGNNTGDIASTVFRAGELVVHAGARCIDAAEFEIFLFLVLVISFWLLRRYDIEEASYKRIFSKD